jgi:hypothetical protein
MDRWKYPLRGHPNAKHCAQWEPLRNKNKLASFCLSGFPLFQAILIPNREIRLPALALAKAGAIRVFRKAEPVSNIILRELWGL